MYSLSAYNNLGWLWFRGDTTVIKKTVPVAFGSLEDLFVDLCPSDVLWKTDTVKEAFAGRKSNPLFRIPSADTGHEIFFNDRELFCRFASMPLPTQEVFLQCIRLAIKTHEVNEIYLDVPWNTGVSRKLRIRCPNGYTAGPMDIDILE